MSEQGALAQAQAKLQELLENARKGMIIPVRLPAQIEEIGQLMAQAEKEHEKALQEAVSAMPADMDAYMTEEAYFVGHAVHELRTPMTSIRGYSDMLGSMGELNDMQKQFLSIIKVNAKRMEGLLADVSVINKLRKRTLKLSPKMDMVKNLLMRVEKDMAQNVQELERQLELDVPQGLPFLNVDTDLLVTALNKLVENGLRYSPKGTGKVTIRASAEGNTLLLTIEDNGVGMTPEEVAKLGTIYFRSDNDVVREYKGSGLGVPIAFGIIERLGGTVQVESAPNKGTRFIIRLEGMS
jgi:two-component system phosphate regulon sensor histidine kinase PhoR